MKYSHVMIVNFWEWYETDLDGVIIIITNRKHWETLTLLYQERVFVVKLDMFSYCLSGWTNPLILTHNNFEKVCQLISYYGYVHGLRQTNLNKFECRENSISIFFNILVSQTYWENYFTPPKFGTSIIVP